MTPAIVEKTQAIARRLTRLAAVELLKTMSVALITALLALPLVVAVTAAAPAGNDDGPYLPRTSLPDAIAILPPPPAPGSAAARADQAVFAATRALAGSARWRIATDDVTNAPLDRFACAMGVQLDAHRAPALARLLDRIGTGDLVGPVKAHYAVRRPYLGGDAPICEPRTAHLAANGDYPSGHAANGWLEGLVLAQLLPGRAGPLSQVWIRRRLRAMDISMPSARPIITRSSSVTLASGRLSKRTSPREGSTPISAFSVVDLPAPLGPISSVISPRRASSVVSFRIVRLGV